VKPLVARACSESATGFHVHNLQICAESFDNPFDLNAETLVKATN
jgi:hypothetical protein